MNKNLVLFITVCLPLRIGLCVGTYFVEQSENTPLIYTEASLLVVAAIGFFIVESSGKEVGFFGGKRYWNSILHGVLFILTAACLFSMIKTGFLLLILDTVVGTIYVANHYYYLKIT